MKKFILIFTVLFNCQSFAAVGGDVGNGGDLIKCFLSDSNKFNGTYVLDYVINYDGWTESIEGDANPIETIWKSLRVKAKTNENFRWMAESLLQFYQSAQHQLYRGPDFKNSIIWMPQPFGLIDLKDEALVQAVPPNCKFHEHDQWKPDLRQAVVQEQKVESVVLRYDANAIRYLPPMQFSYLMIHEWLRGVLPKTGELRDMNKLLHSKVFTEASSSEAELMIYNLIGKKYIYGPLKIDTTRYTIRFANLETKVLKMFPGSSQLLNIAYPQVDQLQCALQDADDEKPIFGTCSTEHNLHDGSTIWISYYPRNSSGGYDKAVVMKLIEAKSDAPDFTLPKP